MDWNLTSFFPQFDGPEMRTFRTELLDGLHRALAHAAALPTPTPAHFPAWESALLAAEELSARLSHIESYLSCLTAADSLREDYAAAEAALAPAGATLTKICALINRGLAEATEADFAALSALPALDGLSFLLLRLRQEGSLQMSDAEESLAADLSVDGMQAWGRLYEKISGQMEFRMEWPDGRTETLPMSRNRSLCGHPDRHVRQAAFTGGNLAWEKMETVAAASLNALSGTRLALNARRKVPHFLDVALRQSSLSRASLDAMFAAVSSSLDFSRSLLDLRASHMRLPGLAWFDLEAPLPLRSPEPEISWEQGSGWVSAAFHRAYPRLGQFFDQIRADDWLDYSPRSGKRPGAFCTTSRLSGESRVYQTFDGSINDVLTLAHEVGHAYHSHLLRGLRPFAQDYPMTLAECASTFAELLLTDGIVHDPNASPALRLRLLDAEMRHASAFLLDIPVRYHFEVKLHQERASGEITVSRLKELMLQTQREILGPILLPGGENPLFWASKLHFHIAGVTFYNFPYTFGYLLSRSLFAQLKNEGPDFLPRYEAFLRRTGSADCETVVRETLGQDITDPEFWSRAIRSLDAPHREFQTLLAETEQG